MISKELRHYNYLIGELEAAYHEAALRLGVSDSEMRILYALQGGEGSLLLSEVIYESALSKQTVNSALRKLEKEELLYLQKVSGRSKRVCLTEKGRDLAEASAGRLMELEDSIIGSWEPAELRLYLDLLQRYTESFRERITEL